MHRPLDARRQVERLPRFEAFDVFQHVPRIRFDGRLAQPGQPGRFAVVPTLEQIVEAAAMRVRQRFGQGIVDAPVGAGDCFGARPLDGVEGRQNGVVCGRGRNPTLRLWPTIFSGKIDVFPGDRRSRLISSMTSVAPA
uniref:Uncharacterized protein n=2 Tax=Klebsiella TaxID=570 RepID=A0A345WXV5_KLEOX|nr:hypothetical protein [Klebsiella oxytoca]